MLVDEGIVVPQAILTYRHGPGLGLPGPASQTYILARLTNLLYGPHVPSHHMLAGLASSLFKLVCLHTRLLISVMTFGCFTSVAALPLLIDLLSVLLTSHNSSCIKQVHQMTFRVVFIYLYRCYTCVLQVMFTLYRRHVYV